MDTLGYIHGLISSYKCSHHWLKRFDGSQESVLNCWHGLKKGEAEHP